MSELAFVDEHVARTDASPERVWDSLTSSIENAFGVLASGYARVVGCEPVKASGPRPFAVGSTVPGFAVTGLDAPHRLVLTGSHRFSVYRLTFTIEQDGSGSTLTGRTDADFPGVLGAGYRIGVVRTGAHALLTGGMVRRIAAAA